MLGATKYMFLNIWKRSTERSTARSLTNVLDHQDDAHDSDLAASAIAQSTPRIKSLHETINNEDVFCDDIEEYLIGSRFQGDLDNKDKIMKKNEYMDATRKLLEHDRQFYILEAHTYDNTLPSGLQIHDVPPFIIAVYTRKQLLSLTRYSFNLLEVQWELKLNHPTLLYFLDLLRKHTSSKNFQT